MLKLKGENVSEFVDQFREFGDWQSLEDEITGDLETILTSTREPRFPGAILPFPSSKKIAYYGVAESGTEWRALRTRLLAFAGPTASDFNGRPHQLDEAIGVEEFLGKCGFHSVTQITPSTKTNQFLRRTLRQMTVTAARIPDTSTASREPRHVLLRKFFNSVASGDLEASLNCIMQMRQGLHLDSMNLLFLEVHARSSVSDWVGITEMREFFSLLQARKPPSIAKALYRALYNAKFSDLVEAGEFDRAIESYKQDWRPIVGRIDEFTTHTISADLAHLLALDALSHPDDRPAYLNDLKLLGLGAISAKLDEAFPEADIPQQTGQEPELLGWAQARAAIIEAVSGNELALKALALERVSALSKEDQSKLFEASWVRPIWDSLVREVTDQPPKDWETWLENLSNPGFQELSEELARAGANEWQHDGAYTNPNLFAEDLKIKAVGSEAQVLHQSLPHLVIWLRSDLKASRPEWKPIYLAVIDAYSLGGEVDAAAREATLPMFELALEVQPTPTEYNDLVEQMDILVGDDPGVHGAWWPLKVAELLFWFQSPNSSIRMHFSHNLLEKLRLSLDRLTPTQRNIARWLADSTEWPWPETDQEQLIAGHDTGLAHSLAGKTIAIYTLTERAAMQAQDVLIETIPDVRIETLADKVSSPRLVAMAQNADLFVMVTGSATHAATDTIRRERSKDKPLLMPFGKGSSSILEAIDRWAGLLQLHGS